MRRYYILLTFVYQHWQLNNKVRKQSQSLDSQQEIEEDLPFLLSRSEISIWIHYHVQKVQSSYIYLILHTLSFLLLSPQTWNEDSVLNGIKKKKREDHLTRSSSCDIYCFDTRTSMHQIYQLDSCWFIHILCPCGTCFIESTAPIVPDSTWQCLQIKLHLFPILIWRVEVFVLRRGNFPSLFKTGNNKK